MKRSLAISLLAILACSAPGKLPASAVETHPADALLPRGTVSVRVMEMMAPPRLHELGTRFQQSVRSHGTWLTEYIKQVAKDGEPLLYHPNMGLTEAEYQEFQGLSRQVRLAPRLQTSLSISQVSPGRFAVDGGKELPDLTGIVVDLGADTVTTPLGTAKTRSAIAATPDQKATGPWAGISWKSSDLDEAAQAGYSVQFAVGRLTETGDGILYYDAKRFANGSTERASRVLAYSLSPP